MCDPVISCTAGSRPSACAAAKVVWRASRSLDWAWGLSDRNLSPQRGVVLVVSWPAKTGPKIWMKAPR
jgi:hypothetical protein